MGNNSKKSKKWCPLGYYSAILLKDGRKIVYDYLERDEQDIARARIFRPDGKIEKMVFIFGVLPEDVTLQQRLNRKLGFSN